MIATPMYYNLDADLLVSANVPDETLSLASLSEYFFEIVGIVVSFVPISICPYNSRKTAHVAFSWTQTLTCNHYARTDIIERF